MKNSYLFILFFLVIINANAQDYNYMELNPVADGFVRQQDKKGVFNLTYTEVRNSIGFNRETYLDFNLSDINIDTRSASLSLYCSNYTAETSGDLVIYATYGNFIDDNLSWDNKLSDEQLELVSFLSTTESDKYKYLKWDVTDFVKKAIREKQEKITFVIKAYSSDSPLINFSTLESENKPILLLSDEPTVNVLFDEINNVYASSTYPGREAVYAVNGSGLSIDGTHVASVNNTAWHSNAGGAPATFKIEFIKPEFIVGMHYWNLNWTEQYLGRGSKNVEIWISDSADDLSKVGYDDERWVKLSDIETQKADGTSGYRGERFDFAEGRSVKWLGLNILSFQNENEKYTGISEIKLIRDTKKYGKITYELPSEGGSFRIMNNGIEVNNGDRIAFGTKLTIDVTVNEGYELSALNVGDSDVKDTKSFVVDGNMEISAVFVRQNIKILNYLPFDSIYSYYAESEYNDGINDRAFKNILNGNGMSDEMTHGFTVNGTMWMTNGATWPQCATICLNDTTHISGLHLWNFNWKGYVSRGVKNFNVYYSLSSDDLSDIENNFESDSRWVKVNSTPFTLDEATGTDSYSGQIIDFGKRVSAKWIGIEILSNYIVGEDKQETRYVGLSELKLIKDWIKPNGDEEFGYLLNSESNPLYSKVGSNAVTRIGDDIVAVYYNNESDVIDNVSFVSSDAVQSGYETVDTSNGSFIKSSFEYTLNFPEANKWYALGFPVPVDLVYDYSDNMMMRPGYNYWLSKYVASPSSGNAWEDIKSDNPNYVLYGAYIYAVPDKRSGTEISFYSKMGDVVLFRAMNESFNSSLVGGKDMFQMISNPYMMSVSAFGLCKSLGNDFTLYRLDNSGNFVKQTTDFNLNPFEAFILVKQSPNIAPMLISTKIVTMLDEIKTEQNLIYSAGNGLLNMCSLENTKVRIYTVGGECVVSDSFVGEKQYELESGVYIVELEFNGILKTIKIIL